MTDVDIHRQQAPNHPVDDTRNLVAPHLLRRRD
jgi:hypothetical protein